MPDIAVLIAFGLLCVAFPIIGAVIADRIVKRDYPDLDGEN